MDRRLQLQTLLETLLSVEPDQGLRVYFQPPTNVVMQYPCITYRRDIEDVRFADDYPYNRQMRYQVTVIDRDPDSPIPDKVAALPMCRFDRFYTADNLNHDVYTIFF